MGENGFRVRPEALTVYAGVIQDQRERMAESRTGLAAVHLPPNAFGHLPDARELQEAYEEHAAAEQQNLADLLEVLAATVDGLRATARSYTGQERATSEGLGGGR